MQARIADVVLDALDVLGDGSIIDAKHQQKSRQELMPEADALRHAAAALGQRKAAIPLMFEIAQFAKLLDHDTHARPAQTKFPRDIRHPRIALFDHQILDSLQIILLAHRDRGF